MKEVWTLGKSGDDNNAGGVMLTDLFLHYLARQIQFRMQTYVLREN